MRRCSCSLSLYVAVCFLVFLFHFPFALVAFFFFVWIGWKQRRCFWNVNRLRSANSFFFYENHPKWIKRKIRRTERWHLTEQRIRTRLPRNIKANINRQCCYRVFWYRFYLIMLCLVSLSLSPSLSLLSSELFSLFLRLVIFGTHASYM